MPVPRPTIQLGLAGALVALASAGQAQELRVRVVDGAGAPAVGAMVSLLGADGAPVASGIVGTLGRARLRPPPGRHRVVVEWPGVEAVTMQAPELGATSLDSMSVSLGRAAAPLPSALVRRPDRCGPDAPGVPASLQAAWAETRKMLAIVALTETARLAELNIAAADRVLSRSLEVEREAVNTLLTPMNRPTNAAPYADHAAEGIAAQQGDSTVWRALDVAAFLDPAFPADHCFGLVNGTGTHLGELGLEFAPPDDGRIRTEGTFWLDARRRMLRSIEYRFTNLPRGWRPERAGGAIELHQSEPGFWITRFWYQRTPRVQTRGSEQRLIGFREQRAEVLSLIPAVDTTDRVATALAIAQREAETRARVSRMQGIVVDTLGGPLGGADVTILGTEHRASTGPDGRFVLDGLTPGAQIAQVRKIGYHPRYFGLRLAGGETWDGRVTLDREPQVLGEIVVVGRYGKPARYANTSKYDDFYRRRATASGRFLTREDIDKSAAGRISELVRAIPGVRVGFRAPGQSEDVSFLNCPAFNIGVWIDGQKLSGRVGELLPLIAPQDVEAVEVYQRESIIPAQFRDNSCGAIVMWTR